MTGKRGGEGKERETRECPFQSCIKVNGKGEGGKRERGMEEGVRGEKGKEIGERSRLRKQGEKYRRKEFKGKESGKGKT